MSDLFSAIKVGPFTLPHRIAMAPLTRNRAGAELAPQPLNAQYYAQRASAAIIISEASQISPQGMGYPNTPGIYSEAQVAAWKLVTSAVHEKGGKIFCQLWHVGRISHPSLQPGGALPVAPSAIKPEGMAVTYEGMKPFVEPRALDLSELPGIVADYKRATENARRAGFDGVEIHGANGYLLDQFLRDGSNKRTDAYGGSAQNRARLMLEVVDAVCAAWSPEHVALRISPNGGFNSMSDSRPLETYGYLLRELNARKLAFLHLVEQMDDDAQKGPPAVTLEWARQQFKGVLMTNARYTKETAELVVSKGLADLVSFGRLFIANPDLPKRFEQNAALNSPDFATFYGGSEKGYTDYPALAS